MGRERNGKELPRNMGSRRDHERSVMALVLATPANTDRGLRYSLSRDSLGLKWTENETLLQFISIKNSLRSWRSIVKSSKFAGCVEVETCKFMGVLSRQFRFR